MPTYTYLEEKHEGGCCDKDRCERKEEGDGGGGAARGLREGVGVGRIGGGLGAARVPEDHI